MTDMACPNCAGQKEFMAHINKGDRAHEWRLMPCAMCKGSGLVSRNQATRYEAARRRRQDRIDSGVSLREEAERLGVSIADLSAQERGYDYD